MVGPPYDCVANPHGAVRLTFEKTVAGLPEADPVAKLCGKDWGVVHLFHKFLFEEDGLSRVPILDQSSLRWIKPNTLVRFRGMVQDMLGKELYIGAFKACSTTLVNTYGCSVNLHMIELEQAKLGDISLVELRRDCEETLEDACERDPPRIEAWRRNLDCSFRLGFCWQAAGELKWTKESGDKQVQNIILMISFWIVDGEKRSAMSYIYEAMDIAKEAIINSFNEKDDKYMDVTRKDDGCIFRSVVEPMLCDRMPENMNHLDDDSFSCLVKAYDFPESYLKLNDVFEFIGIYTFDPHLVVNRSGTDDSSFDLMEDVSNYLPPSKVPRLHSLVSRKLSPQDFLSGSLALQPLPSMMREIRESLLVHLSALMGNDKVAAQFLLLHLLSRVRGKVDVVALGKLSLNLTGFTRESASVFGNRLNDTIMKLLPFSKVIPISVEYLNTAVLQPRKNNQSGRLVMGVLQLAQGTHLTIDETHLETGMLNSVGVENASLLRHLLEWQTVEYVFEYYKIDMAADVQILIFSEGKSNILPADLVLPFQPHSFDSVEEPSSEELQTWRWYLATAKSLPYSNAPEVQQILQDGIVAAMQEDRSLGYKDLSRLPTMAQLLSTSSGETSLSLEQWQNVKELERLRKERLK
ncbi:Mini-chromosome maintenance complex-binding protein [Platanthera guangdongensis]|uniref:Mini-chromosome maintenance complex-binding protein n=1 Tax=Platanthera guangdongensis TaxID=2320717 RepID=A0ABR2M0J7_9ASPA